MLRLIKLEFYFRLAMYHFKKSNKHAQKYVDHREKGKYYERKHSKV